MASSRKCYFHSKSDGPSKVSRSRTSSKSSDLFDQVVNESSTNSVVQPPSLKSGQSWSLASRELEMEGKKKERCDDKAKSRGGMLYNFSPFYPSPVKEPSSQASIESSVAKETTISNMALDQDEEIENASIFTRGASVDMNNVKAIGVKENLKVFDFDDEEVFDGSSSSQNKPIVVMEKPTCKPTTINRRYTSIRGVAKRGGVVSTKPGRVIVKKISRIKEASEEEGKEAEGRVDRKSDGHATDILRGVTAMQDERGVPLSNKLPPRLPPVEVKSKHDMRDAQASAASSSNVRHSHKLPPRVPPVGVKSKHDVKDSQASAPSSSNVRHSHSKEEDMNIRVPLASRDVTIPPVEVGMTCHGRNGVLVGCAVDRGPGPLKRKRDRAGLELNKDLELSHSDDPYDFDQLEDKKPISDSNSKLGENSESGSKLLASYCTKPHVLDTGSQGMMTDSVDSGKLKLGSSQPKKLMEEEVELTPQKRSVDSDAHMLHQIDSMLVERGDKKNGNVSTKRADVGPTTCTSNFVHRSKVSHCLKKSSSDFSKNKTRKYAYTTRPLSSSAGVSGEGVPRMSKSLSWPQRCKRDRERSVVRCPKKVKKLAPPAVRGVHGAYQCVELGESRLFFEEMQYLVDSIKPCQPLQMRCLGTCNLASQYLEIEFSRQLRAHGYISSIISLLKDCLQYPSLCLCTAVLFYVMTRDRLCVELGEEGTGLLVGMLATPHQSQQEVETKQAGNMDKLKAKARYILQKVEDQSSNEVDTPPPEDELDDEELLPLSQPTSASEEVQRKEKKKEEFKLSTEEISVSELARECVISLSSPQNNPQLLRDQLRTQGALDHLANMVIASCDKLSAIDLKGLDDELCDQVKSISCTAWMLDRQLKSIENLTLMNPSNQSYLVVFDGSLLISKLTQFLRVAHQLLSRHTLRSCGLMCLLAVFKILLNLTHESELGSHRVGEQKGVMDYILHVILQCPDEVLEGDKFDISILALSLLINLTELSSANCRLLESVRMDRLIRREGECTPTHHMLEDADDAACNGCVAPRGSSVKALVHLFLQLNSKADSVNIKVPTPQRLSQLSGTSPRTSAPSPPVTSAPGPRHALAPGHCSRGESSIESSSSARGRTSGPCRTDLSGRLADSVKGFSTPTDIERSRDWHHHSRPPDKVGDVSLGMEDEEEECVPIEMDPLVFDRKEFNCALDQAGRHMEDSILSSYLALLLGNIAAKDHDMVDFIRDLMPSRSFSEMMKALKQFVSFMSMAGSDIGLDSIRHTIKYLEALQPSQLMKSL